MIGYSEKNGDGLSYTESKTFIDSIKFHHLNGDLYRWAKSCLEASEKLVDEVIKRVYKKLESKI